MLSHVKYVMVSDLQLKSVRGLLKNVTFAYVDMGWRHLQVVNHACITQMDKDVVAYML